MGTIASRSSSDRVRGITAERAAPGRGRPRGSVPSVAEGLQRLSRVEAGPHRVVSCYLKLEPRDRSRSKYLIKLKNRVREVVTALPRLGLSRSVQMEVERDLERVQAYFATPANLPDTHGIAVFACAPLELFEVMPLPVVYRSRLAVDATPLVRELASVEDEFGRLLDRGARPDQRPILRGDRLRHARS